MSQLSLEAKVISCISIYFHHQLTFVSCLIDLQNVNITLRILFRPVPTALPGIYTTLGIDYDERVLPSITTEILKAVVVSCESTQFRECL